jgi:adenylate kinase
MAGLLRLAGTVRSLSCSHRTAALAHRRHAAAAAVEDCWSDWEDEEEEKRALYSAPAAETCPVGGGPQGVQWVVMGRPGPQKHAHAARLAEVLDVPYISMGTLVRQELSPASQLYKKVSCGSHPLGTKSFGTSAFYRSIRSQLA